MVIRTSASQEVRRLVAELIETEATPEVRREAAIARLSVIGTRAVRQLVDAFETTPDPLARSLLLRAMEGIPDPRLVGVVGQGLQSADPDVQVAAARAARGLLAHPQGTPLLDGLTALALETRQRETVRLAALEALLTLSPRTIRPLLERLHADPSPAVRDAVQRDRLPVEDPVAELEDASDGWLPRDPHAVAQLVARAAPQAPLSTLHRLIEKVRNREEEGRRSRRREWQAVRGTLHLALARRGSRVALYDVREALERAEEPLPPEFLEALALAGDAACLEAVAAAFVHAEMIPDAEQWRRLLAHTFQAIMSRERITRRHGIMRRLQSRFGVRMAPLLPPAPATTAPVRTRTVRRGRSVRER